MFVCTVLTLLFMVIVAVTVLVYLLLYCAYHNYSIVYCRRELCIVLDLAFTAIALVTVLSIPCWLPMNNDNIVHLL